MRVTFSWLVAALFFVPTLFSKPYESSAGQDRFVNKHFFHNKKNGVFIDIGAHAGKKFSNTYFFEKELGWKGICFEPSKTRFQDLKKNRDCICINAAVAEENTTMDFVDYQAGWVSGLRKKYHPNHLKRWRITQNIQKGSAKVYKVQCVKLNDVLEEHEFHHIDFISIDTEGGELDILKSIDFDKYTIDVICVEDHKYLGDDIINFVKSKGYKHCKLVGKDRIFRKLK